MSNLTLADLCACDPASFHQAAYAWQGMAEDLDNTTEEFIRLTHQLPDAWSDSIAADAALRTCTHLRSLLSSSVSPARNIYRALTYLADSMIGLKNLAENIIAEARSVGLSVDITTQQITAPSSLYQSGSPEQVSYLVNRYANELTSVLERARCLDDETVAVIHENIPGAVAGFGATPAPAISSTEVENQRGKNPVDVHAWWTLLTPEQREQAIRDYPRLVGWLDGVPAEDRDTANRIDFARQKTGLDRQAHDLERRLEDLRQIPTHNQSRWNVRQVQLLENELEQVNKQRKNLGKLDKVLADLGPKGLLLGVDCAHEGKAIVAVGNPDTAKHTAVYVPGINTDLGDVNGDVKRVRNLQTAASDMASSPNDVAAIMWLGYDTPELSPDSLDTLGTMAGTGRSEKGAVALDNFVNGLRATHGDGPYHVTAVGHSYGSTVVAQAALHGDGLAVNDIITAGSPGMDTEHVDDLINANPRHVWAGSAEDDPVSNASNTSYGRALRSGGGAGGNAALDAYESVHGPSPHGASFGANRYHVDTSGHSEYWNEETESLRNQARIVVGKYSMVSLDHGSPPPVYGNSSDE